VLILFARGTVGAAHRECGNGEPVVFDQRPDFAGTILAGLLILFPATLALMLFIEASANNNPVLTLIAFVLYSWIAICITVKRLHDLDATCAADNIAAIGDRRL
jgi:hypothetical protein